MGRRVARSKAVSSKVHVPTIVCVNHATVPLGVDFDALIAAMQVFVDKHVAPVWGTRAKLVKSRGLVPGKWAMVFLDHADHAHSLAYHDLTPDGLPLSRVFVKTTLKNKKLVSVSASHELVEMLVDPSINLVAISRPSTSRAPCGSTISGRSPSRSRSMPAATRASTGMASGSNSSARQ